MSAFETLPVDVHAVQDCLVIFSPCLESLSPSLGQGHKTLEQLALLGRKRLASLSLHFFFFFESSLLTFILGSWLSCWFGWG